MVYTPEKGAEAFTARENRERVGCLSGDGLGLLTVDSLW